LKRFNDRELKQDALVQLYKQEEYIGKSGKPTRKAVLANEIFRVFAFVQKTVKIIFL
jgi:hypothetical protein